MAASGDKAPYISLPNALSLFRILVTPFFLYFSYTQQNFIALSLFVLAALSDWGDGFLARYLKQESILGELLDPLADKFLLVASFIGFYFLGKIPLWVALVVVSRDIFLLLAGLIILMKKYDFRMKPARLSKFNTLLQILYIAAISLNSPEVLTDTLAYVACLTTVLSTILYVHVFKTWYHTQ